MADDAHALEKLRIQAALLLSQARAQSDAVQRALSALPADSPLRLRLAGIATQLANASSGLTVALNGPLFSLTQTDLVAWNAVVNVDAISALLAEAAAQTAAGSTAMQTLAIAASATRQEVQTLATDIFERRIFDGYLRFDSTEDEEAFRRREAACRQYIDAQLARHTPEGDLNAGGGVLGYMLDAHAHGAGDSPDFAPRWNVMVEKVQQQRAAMLAAGQSTEEFDRTLLANVRAFLKHKRLTDAEIDARLAQYANPLDAVKSEMANDRASRRLENQIELTALPTAAVPPLPRVTVIEDGAAPDVPLTIDPEAIRARLKAAGVLTIGSVEPAAGHGLPPQKSAGKPGQSVVS